MFKYVILLYNKKCNINFKTSEERKTLIFKKVIYLRNYLYGAVQKHVTNKYLK